MPLRAGLDRQSRLVHAAIRRESWTGCSATRGAARTTGFAHAGVPRTSSVYPPPRPADRPSGPTQSRSKLVRSDARNAIHSGAALGTLRRGRSRLAQCASPAPAPSSGERPLGLRGPGRRAARRVRPGDGADSNALTRNATSGRARARPPGAVWFPRPALRADTRTVDDRMRNFQSRAHIALGQHHTVRNARAAGDPYVAT